jgi:hypothetical protein
MASTRTMLFLYALIVVLSARDRIIQSTSVTAVNAGLPQRCAQMYLNNIDCGLDVFHAIIRD